eukprot:gene18958-24768_t
MSKPFVVLGIESSCDDTGVGIVRSDGLILSNVVYTQYNIHEKFGGVVPGLAMNAHKDNIEKAIQNALIKANLSSIDEVDAIAVTKGPGLEICLRVGWKKALALANEYNKPFVVAHHLEAHCLTARLAGRIDFPYLTLLLSGGHSSIMLCKGLGDYIVLGATLDDSLGEALDKGSRLLGLRFNQSGGAAIEELARKGNPSKYKLSIPMLAKRDCNFSYAGLKNAFRLLIDKCREEEGLQSGITNAPSNTLEETKEIIRLPDQITADLCATLQDVAFAHVENKLKRALDYIEYHNIKLTSVAVVGGVASNQSLRNRLLNILERRDYNDRLPLIFPPIDLCTDNGAMIAWAGIEKFKLGISDSLDDTDVFAKWPLGDLVDHEIIIPKKK